MALRNMRFETIEECVAYFSNEEHARALWVEVFFPGGLICERCGSSSIKKYSDGINRVLTRWRCSRCGLAISFRRGTYANYSKLPLGTWLAAEYIIDNFVREPSRIQLSQYLGVARHSCARLIDTILEARELALMGEIEDSLDDMVACGKAEINDLGEDSALCSSDINDSTFFKTW